MVSTALMVLPLAIGRSSRAHGLLHILGSRGPFETTQVVAVADFHRIRALAILLIAALTISRKNSSRRELIQCVTANSN
ncbi:hypothetical protein F5Y12DRAFT_779795 [Xylaria sp. FL1777]|nr:hypothetical protein F5Y12DRAFT_779795 [Xylaria sp. FL1777]